MIDRERIRRIIKLAAKNAPSARQWLILDEKGTWEKTVAEYLEKVASDAEASALPEKKIDEQIAVRISLLALEALLRSQKRK